jgi:hypothetical protein
MKIEKLTFKDINSLGIAGTGKQSEIDENEVTLSRKFIKERLKPSKIRSRSSYELKQNVEDAMGCYISNGAFITAALKEGAKVERYSPDNPDARIFLIYKRRGLEHLT